jgi:C1A family cysteine protease
MTEEEFNQRYHSAKLNKPVLVPKVDNLDSESRPHMVRASKIPEYVNWREAGMVSDSVDQGGCGSCWAFTTATTLESLNAIQNNLDKVPTYSVQYLLDCDDVDWGCDGGWMADAYTWTADHGIVAWSDYPKGYQGRKNKC